MPDLLTAFGIMALVLLLSALASGLVERLPLSFPMIFLGIGALLGEHGLGLLRVDAHDGTLEAVAILSLTLVLFLDAVRLEFDQGRQAWVVPALVLGPGTLLTIALVALAGTLLLGVSPVIALLLGAILASTDPVVLRDVVRDPRIPSAVRRVLKIEAGTNDIVVLPLVLVLIAVARVEATGVTDWLVLLAQLFVVSPVVGFAVGGAGSWLVGYVDRRLPIRREYQALYGVGLVLAAYAAGQAVQGDGFLAAFFAGAAVAVLNHELCDCFLEYGEVTAEMAMLLAFVLFGAVLSELLGAGMVPLLPALLFALFTIGVARPLAQSVVLRRATLSPQARGFIAWFGPRGLNSLLLALLVVLHGVAGAETLLGVVGVVVIVSVVLHGASATPLAGWYARYVATRTLPEERESTAAGVLTGSGDAVVRLDVAGLARELAGPEPPVVLDVRSRSQYDRDAGQIPGSVRVLPDQVDAWAASADPRTRRVVTYCT